MTLKITTHHLILPLSCLLTMLVSACGLAGEPTIIGTAIPPIEVISAESAAESIGQPDLSLGAQVFSENCTACHGLTGLGDGPSAQSGAVPNVPNFRQPDTLTTSTAEAIYAVVTEGRLDRLMPPWAGVLSDAERWSVANYVLSLMQGTPPMTAEQPLPVSAPFTESEGVIAGLVTNGTANGRSVEGTSIGLQVLDSEMNEVDFRMTPVTGGAYRFDQVAVRTDYTYLVTAIFDGGVYDSGWLVLNPEEPAISIPITVYERTASPEHIEINLLVTRVERREDEVIFTEIINFRNVGDRVFAAYDPASGREQSVHLALPAGAQVLNLPELDNCCLIEDGVVYDLRPLLPNDDHMMRIAYTLPYASGTAIDFPLDYPLTNQIELMLEPGQFAVDTTGFIDRGVQQFATGDYHIFLADAPAPGTNVHAEIVDAPFSLRSSLIVALVLGIIGTALMLSAAIGYLRLRATQPSHEALLAQITTLDNQYKAGRIQARRYQAQRARLKSQLAQGLKQ